MTTIEKAKVKYGLQQIPYEIKELMQFIKPLVKRNLLEIGSYTGGSFLCLNSVMTQTGISISMDAGNLLNKTLQEELKKEPEFQNRIIHFLRVDSHAPITKLVYERIMTEEIDVLFIDGDHSETGVKMDYEEYKPYVADGGLIIFHDIKTTRFHVETKCAVDRLWKTLRGEKWEIKYDLNEDENYGGIGILGNEKTNYKIFQIFYNEQTKSQCYNFSIKYNNQKLTKYYENDVIKNLAQMLEEEPGNMYYGILSWRVQQKTKLTENQIKQKIEAQNNYYDVLFFPPEYSKDWKWLEPNRDKYSEIYQCVKLIDETKILPFQIEKTEWTNGFCNYWIAKKRVYLHYCNTTLKAIYKIFEENENIKNYLKEHPMMHRGISRTIEPFILETLMGFHVNHFKIKHKRIIYNE